MIPTRFSFLIYRQYTLGTMTNTEEPTFVIMFLHIKTNLPDNNNTTTTTMIITIVIVPSAAIDKGDIEGRAIVLVPLIGVRVAGEKNSTISQIRLNICILLGDNTNPMELD